MQKKIPPKVLSTSELVYISGMHERDNRWLFLVARADSLRSQGLSYRKFCIKMGICHDTSVFVCDNIERVQNNFLKEKYFDTRIITVLYDGCGSNFSFHKIFKQNLMYLADRLNMRLLVMHYPKIQSH